MRICPTAVEIVGQSRRLFFCADCNWIPYLCAVTSAVGVMGRSRRLFFYTDVQTGPDRLNIDLAYDEDSPSALCQLQR